MDKIADDISWVGYCDWDVRNFHGYETPIGTTYNAYLIDDECPTLIDTVKYYGVDEMLRRIRAVMDPSKIRYIISNHTEMDHSGSIDALLAYCPDAEVVCSPKGEEHLRKHFKKDWKFKVVTTGDVLSIGKRTLQFVLTPMVHWPDNMVTYCPETRILFSNDAFGQHIASVERYADEYGNDRVFYEAAKYYANIVLPYGNQVMKALDAVATVAVDTICPSHGLMWRKKEDIEKLIAKYTQWACHETENRVLIVYDTMWKSTETMAQYLYAAIDREQIAVKLINLQQTHISDIITDVLEAKMMCIGSPILNNRVLPTMASLLMYMKGLKPQKRYAATFGSYGWATVGFKEFEAALTEAGFTVICDGIYQQFVPEEKDLKQLDAIVTNIKNKLQ